MKQKVIEIIKDFMRFYAYTASFGVLGGFLAKFLLNNCLYGLATISIFIICVIYCYFYVDEDKEIKKNRKHEIKTNMEAE